MRGSLERVRLELAERLRERRGDIGQAVITRALSIADPTEAGDPSCTESLRAAVDAAVDYGLASIDGSQARSPRVPTVLLAQARVAARNGVTLDTVLRRYFAGYTLLCDFLTEEAQKSESVSPAELERLLLAQAANFDRLVAAVTEEHACESEARLDSAGQRRIAQVRRLLGGELVDSSELAAELRYDFEGHHVGLVVSGLRTSQALRDLAARLGCQLLLVHPQRGTAWAWIGGRDRIDPAELISILEPRLPAQVAMAVGESEECLGGWRASHRQAATALPLAVLGADPVVRYTDVALLAMAMQDDLLATSLHELYLAPLGAEKDGGETLLQTLGAYFLTGHDISSTAARLGVSRHTVANRIRTIEERLGRPISSCAPELRLALQLHDLDRENWSLRPS